MVLWICCEGHGLQVVCEHAAVALVAVPRVKLPLTASADPRRPAEPCRDLLALAPDGQLRLFVGSSLTLSISLPQQHPMWEPFSGTERGFGGGTFCLDFYSRLSLSFSRLSLLIWGNVASPSLLRRKGKWRKMSWTLCRTGIEFKGMQSL